MVPIFIIPLRQRKEDIPALVLHFLQKFNDENNKNVSISPDILEIFLKYDWPGNVRELENYIERLVVMSFDEKITSDSLSFIEFNAEKSAGDTGIKTHISQERPSNELAKSLEEIEKEKILESLRLCANVQSKAARRLGITPRKLGLRIKKYGIVLDEK
ncbi:hypothetical protein HY745_14980 [Candidatus Desantisbacteria bacterium]|nr:hypothetical protein [Candidatus Desantisbacteria bacterium]